MSSGRDEVEAAVNPGVWDHLLPCDTQLLVQVLIKLLIDVLQNGCPARRGEERGGERRREGRSEERGEERGGERREGRDKLMHGTYWYTKYASIPFLPFSFPSPPPSLYLSYHLSLLI